MIVECDRCGRNVEAREVAHYDGGDRWDDVVRDVRYVFLRCPDCDDPFVSVSWGEFDSSISDLRWEPPRTLYPRPRKHVGFHVPRSIREPLDDALKSMYSHAFAPCVVACRKAVEALCAELGEKPVNNLKSALGKLKGAKIDERQFEWADQLRKAGRVAAHEHGRSINREDAEDAVFITQALIEYTYPDSDTEVFRERFESFRERSAKKQTGGASSAPPNP